MKEAIGMPWARVSADKIEISEWEPPASCGRECVIFDSGPRTSFFFVSRYTKTGDLVPAVEEKIHRRSCDKCGKVWDLITKTVDKE